MFCITLVAFCEVFHKLMHIYGEQWLVVAINSNCFFVFLDPLIQSSSN